MGSHRSCFKEIAGRCFSINPVRSGVNRGANLVEVYEKVSVSLKIKPTSGENLHKHASTADNCTTLLGKGFKMICFFASDWGF